MRELAIDVEEAVAKALGHFVAEVVDLTALFGVRCGALFLNVLHAMVEDLEGRRPRCLYSVVPADRTPAKSRCGKPWPESGWLHCRDENEAGAINPFSIYMLRCFNKGKGINIVQSQLSMPSPKLLTGMFM